MTKILKMQKDRIEEKFVQFAFEKQTAELIAEKNALFYEVYEETFDVATRGLMSSLPDGFLHTTSVLHVNAGGYDVDVWSGSNLRYAWSSDSDVKLRIPSNRYNSRINITKQSLINKIQKHVMTVKSMFEESDKLKYKVRSSIRNMSTVKQFTDAYPDHETILGKNFFGTVAAPVTAITTTSQEIMCTVAKFRGENRDGCCDGVPVAVEV